MTESGSDGALTICVVTSNITVASSLKASCPPPNELRLFRNESLVTDQHVISEHGRRIVESAATADVVLVEWSFEEAPAINTLCFQIRRDLLAPVFMIHSSGPETMTACLAAGADDALTLPVYLPYVKAKVLSYRRLITAAKAAPKHGGFNDHVADDLVFGPLRLNRRTHRFYITDEEVELTPREFALLEYLIQQAGTLCSRTQILEAVWGINFDTGTNMVDVYMHYLRKKLESRALHGVIETVRGLGYRLSLPGQQLAD